MWLVRSLESFGHIFNLRRRRKITTTKTPRGVPQSHFNQSSSPKKKTKNIPFSNKKGRGHSPTLQKLLQQSGCSNRLTIGNFEPRISRLDDALGIPSRNGDTYDVEGRWWIPAGWLDASDHMGWWSPRGETFPLGREKIRKGCGWQHFRRAADSTLDLGDDKQFGNGSWSANFNAFWMMAYLLNPERSFHIAASVPVRKVAQCILHHFQYLVRRPFSSCSVHLGQRQPQKPLSRKLSRKFWTIFSRRLRNLSFFAFCFKGPKDKQGLLDLSPKKGGGNTKDMDFKE